MTTTVLAFDLGTVTGWATRRDGRVFSGTANFRPDRYTGGGMKFLRFRRWLTELKATTGGVEEIVFEEVRRHLARIFHEAGESPDFGSFEFPTAWPIRFFAVWR